MWTAAERVVIARTLRGHFRAPTGRLGHCTGARMFMLLAAMACYGGKPDDDTGPSRGDAGDYVSNAGPDHCGTIETGCPEGSGSGAESAPGLAPYCST